MYTIDLTVALGMTSVLANFVISNAVVRSGYAGGRGIFVFARQFAFIQIFAFLPLFWLIAAWAYFFLLDKKETTCGASMSALITINTRITIKAS